jgi:hypothetical protein
MLVVLDDALGRLAITPSVMLRRTTSCFRTYVHTNVCQTGLIYTNTPCDLQFMSVSLNLLPSRL